MTSLENLRQYFSTDLKHHHFEDNTKFRCESCKGKGLQIIETTKTKIKQSIKCFPCEGKGYHTFSEVVHILVNKNCFCECKECKECDEFDLIFFKDNEHSGCLRKSHYHCDICGLLKS